ncbi:MAG: hypothetical protein P4L31_00810 [Candidatus Babeliales bacterium]|nr:hypothetical protein [Candidatus Babeliales bacterium]
MKLSSVFITVTILLTCLSPVGIFKQSCRSHDRFMFLCHHNDTNTNIYLRRISTKLDKIFEQIDQTPSEIKEYNKIENDTYRSMTIVSCVLKQLQLLKAGKLQTGLLAYIIPLIFINYDNENFDLLTDVIVCSLTEHYDYTKEEADSLRSILLERSMGAHSIKYCGLSSISSNLRDVIKYEMMLAIKEENNFHVPENLWRLLYDRTSDRDSSKTKSIMKAIEDGKINDFDELCRFIRKTFSINTKLSTQNN